MINDFSYFFFVILIDLFPNLNMQIILLGLPFLIILSCWIYLLVNSIRSYNIFKPTSIKRTLVNNINYKSKGIFPYVSVILPARNEQENIKKCLHSLLSQDYCNYEIIAVDDNSSDNTLSIMLEVQKEYYNKQKNKRLPKFVQTKRNYPILKIISLNDKPEDWTGKTWASEQGYLKSTGNILLFTDADTIYKKNCILYAISYMLNEKLDVITGYPFIELRDFWSKISMPLWKLMSFTLGKDDSQVNDPKSKVAYLMGCFFMIKRDVFENIDTFKSVKNAIQEDEALGIRIKQSGYKLRIISMSNLIHALWSRDLSTLWHGIGRTLAPMILKEKEKVFINFVSIIFMTTLPHMLLLYTIYLNFIYSNIFAMQNNTHIFDNYYHTLLMFNLIICLMSLIGICIKTVKTYKINPLYTLLSPIGSIFLIIAYLSTIIPFLISSKSIEWKGRTFAYKRKDNPIM